MTRGQKQDVDHFINDLLAQYLPWQEGKMLQLGVHPIQLWELCMPKESLQTIMRTMWDNQGSMDKYKKQLTVLRLALKTKKVPPLNTKVMPRIVFKTNVATYPIGIREDKEVTEYL